MIATRDGTPPLYHNENIRAPILVDGSFVVVNKMLFVVRARSGTVGPDLMFVRRIGDDERSLEAEQTASRASAG